MVCEFLTCIAANEEVAHRNRLLISVSCISRENAATGVPAQAFASATCTPNAVFPLPAMLPMSTPPLAGSHRLPYRGNAASAHSDQALIAGLGLEFAQHLRDYFVGSYFPVVLTGFILVAGAKCVTLPVTSRFLKRLGGGNGRHPPCRHW